MVTSHYEWHFFAEDITAAREHRYTRTDGAPEKLRDSLGLSPGEPLVAEQRDDEIVIRRKDRHAPGLVKDERTSLLVYDSGLPPGSEDIVSLIEADRERRMRSLLGDVDEPSSFSIVQ